MNLGQILLEIKNLGIYSPEEWEEYLSCFENTKKDLQRFEESSSEDFPETLLERVQSDQGANIENVNADISPKIISADHLSNPEKMLSMTLGVVSGCYDLLHLGHMRGFVFAKQFLGQYPNPKLCALVLSDESVRAKKGRSRPVLCVNERLKMLCRIRCLNYIVPLEKSNCLTVLEEVKPDYFFKTRTDTIQGTVKVEMSSVEANGGTVVMFPSPKSFSTTGLIKAILKE